MTYGIGGYQLIDLNGIDLAEEYIITDEFINDNRNLYNQIEKANKNKPLVAVNITKDKIEYQASFINIEIKEDGAFAFYLLDKYILVLPEEIIISSTHTSVDLSNDNYKELTIDLYDESFEYNHTEIYTFNSLNKEFQLDIMANNIKSPYNTIFVNPQGAFNYVVKSNPTASIDIDIENFTYVYNIDSKLYDISYTIKVYNLVQLIVEYDNGNVYFNFITNAGL